MSGSDSHALVRLASRLARPVALLLAVAALALCVVALVHEWGRVSGALADANWWWLAVALASATMAMVLVSLGWGRCISALGGPTVPPRIAVAWFLAGDLGKYLPGGVWSVLGRSEVARRGGVARPVAYASVALSLVVFYGLAMLPVAAIALHPRVLGWWLGLARKVLGRPIELVVPRPAVTAKLFLFYVPVWVATVGCTLAVCEALGVEGSVPRLAFATIAAWLAGFLAVPVPSGAGIREVVFVALAGLPAGLAVAVAVTCRVCFLVVDGVGGATSAAWVGLNKPRPLAPTSS